MKIFSVIDETEIHGNFTPEVSIVGASREECLMAIQGQCQFFQDIGPSTRSDAYLDENGNTVVQEIALYTLIGGSVR